MALIDDLLARVTALERDVNALQQEQTVFRKKIRVGLSLLHQQGQILLERGAWDNGAIHEWTKFYEDVLARFMLDNNDVTADNVRKGNKPPEESPDRVAS